MKKRIVIHATNRPADMSVTLNDIEDMNSQDMKSDPMPYHYIVNIDGRTMKGKRDKELCGHCGKFSRDSISVAYAGGIDAEGEAANTLSETQETVLRFMVGQLMERYPEAKVVGKISLGDGACSVSQGRQRRLSIRNVIEPFFLSGPVSPPVCISRRPTPFHLHPSAAPLAI